MISGTDKIRRRGRLFLFTVASMPVTRGSTDDSSVLDHSLSLSSRRSKRGMDTHMSALKSSGLRRPTIEPPRLTGHFYSFSERWIQII